MYSFRCCLLMFAFWLLPGCMMEPDKPAPPVAPVAAAPSTPAGYVSRKMLGKEWPLTVEDGVLHSRKVATLSNGDPLRSVTFTAPNGTVYALNGTAMSRNEGKDITPIWAKTADKSGSRKDIGVLIDRGMALPPQ